MNLCVDIGNSLVKIGIFDNDDLVSSLCFTELGADTLSELSNKFPIGKCIVGSTIGYPSWLAEMVKSSFPHTIFLTSDTKIPIKNMYRTPETLGPDRLSAVIGAYSQTHSDTLVIDSGTAITYDMISSKGEYLGGNISPGIEMRFRALNMFTAKLPLVDKEGPLPECGYDTYTAIRCGVINGVKYEIEQFIKHWILKYPNLSIFFTGGCDINFDNSIKSRIFADKYIVLKGLNIVLSCQEGL